MKKTITRRLLAIGIDTIFTLMLSVVLFAFLQFVILMNAQISLLTSVFLCMLLPVFVNGKTIGKAAFGIEIVTKGEKNRLRVIFVREVILKFLLFIIVPYMILGFCSQLNPFNRLILIFAGLNAVNVVAYLLFRKFVWDFITKTNVQIVERQKGKSFFARTLFSLIIDISIVYPLSYFVYFLIIRYLYIDFFAVFISFLIIYFLISYSFYRNTLGKLIVGLKLELPERFFPRLKLILLREVAYKFGVAFLLPIITLYVLRYQNNLINIAFIVTLCLLFCLYFMIVVKQNWWSYFSKTKLTKIGSPANRSKIIFLVLIFYVMSFGGLRFLNNRVYSDHSCLGFNLFVTSCYYPVDGDVKQKVDFINKCKTSPKEYVFELFEKNDIVIIGERLHPETTQWDLIYDIVSDQRFINNVGNVFTEYGASDKQYLADEYFAKKYENDTLLEMATTNLLRNVGTNVYWPNRNIFIFFKKLNALNNHLPDSLKIKEHFTDINAFSDSVKTRADYFRIITSNRDSLMASVVINQFNKIKKDSKRKKCLVVTNFRHSFNRFENEKSKKGKQYMNEAPYIFDAFPGKTANVLINSVALESFMFFAPIHNGAWDKSFSECNNKSIGFDFSKSPFGEDCFDLHFQIGKRTNIKYQDVYTGFIFYTPISDFKIQQGIPYIMNGFETEYKRRLFIGGMDTTKTNVENQRTIDENDNRIGVKGDISSAITLYLPYNNLEIIFYFLFFTLGVLVLLCQLFKKKTN